MSKWLFKFETKEIQKFILQGNKLKDMIGGSEIINELCEKYILGCLKELGIPDSDYEIIFTC